MNQYPGLTADQPHEGEARHTGGGTDGQAPSFWEQGSQWRRVADGRDGPAGPPVEVDGETLEEDTFDVELKVRSPPPYVTWSGRYAPNIAVQERHFINREESRRAGAIAPEQARDLAFLIANLL